MNIKTIKQAVLSEIQKKQQEKQPIVVAIDGRCASGKTTLAQALQAELDCNIIHMDDFFLRPEQRTSERYQMIGGNVDYERLQAEVFEPLKQGQTFSYRPFVCSTQTLGELISVTPKSVIIIEGSYSCHPFLWDSYVLHIFLTINPEDQLVRLEKRNARKLKDFQNKWIPLEEAYFTYYKIPKKCELCFEVDTMEERSGSVNVLGTNVQKI